MKLWGKSFAFLILLSSPLFAITNLINFNYGRMDPKTAAVAGSASDREGTRGSAWSLDAMHSVGPFTYFGFETGHFGSGDNISSTFSAGNITTLSAKATSFLAVGRLDLSKDQAFTPYLMGGLGWTRNSLTMTMPAGTLLDDSANALGFAAGAGADLSYLNRYIIGVEARYQGSSKGSFATTALGQQVLGVTAIRASVNAVIFSLKAGIRY